MKKLTPSLIAIILTGIVIGSIRLEICSIFTPVNGMIASDTMWTKSSSPYLLTGPVLVSKGVTLKV